MSTRARVARKAAEAGIGLALAGGAPEGAIYEIGALRALEEQIAGLDLNPPHFSVGASAGACIAANLANQIAVREMCAALAGDGRDLDDEDHPFVPETF